MDDCTPLAIARYRFTARMLGELRLPTYAGSLLRGIFGAALRRTACMTGLPSCPPCGLWRTCPYPALFETPPSPTQLPQQFEQVPNPFVIEPPPLGLRGLAAGEDLVFHMVLVGPEALRMLPLVVHAWQRALRHGVGKERVPGELLCVDWLPADGREEQVYGDDLDRVAAHEAKLHLPTRECVTAEAFTLDIHTPLRLQRDGHALGPRNLGPRVLLAQLLRRTNLILDLHLGIRPAPFDARALLARADAIRDDRSGLRWQDWIRYSSRQKQEMTLGGVVGRWTLEGDADLLAEFCRWLYLGQWLHLGKNATMGMGGYQLVLQQPHVPGRDSKQEVTAS
jgi:hypothetical protein